MLTIVEWGPPTTMFVLLRLQICTYHRTRHYGLAILVAASAAAFLYYGMGKLLSVEALSPRIHLTEANKVLSRPKAD